MKTYKLIKPIGDYPLEEYTKEGDKEYDELMYNDIINGNIYKESKQALKNKPLPPKENKQGTIQIKHCDCGCDNIGKL